MATLNKILFVEDEPALAEIVKETLVLKGFEVTHTLTAKETIIQYHKIKPDILVLDVMLPDGDGFSIAKQLRQIDTKTPIIFLTSKSLPADVVMGFESGGNDYLKKPFSIEELVIRIKALLSQNRLVVKIEEQKKKVVHIGNYHFHYPEGILTFEGTHKTLTNREAEILQMLLLNKNNVLDRNLILNTLWNNNDYFSGRSLDVFITKLRKYLKHDPSVFIINIRGQGYKLIY
ncbi:response regulator transcription factor [Pedobacter miscanthi]|uniref:DNA-binding response regulator n=1 Tax=Pedobacter miscanthi TaxID=2259170 RepID=A0A366KZJ4_9SPHI|nr:response regulator transcription factor [Pedobacter miscanthi]RBQ07047.1 DNA-binding response regulator [Pedobacter miscanthi]